MDHIDITILKNQLMRPTFESTATNRAPEVVGTPLPIFGFPRVTLNEAGRYAIALIAFKFREHIIVV